MRIFPVSRDIFTDSKRMWALLNGQRLAQPREFSTQFTALKKELDKTGIADYHISLLWRLYKWLQEGVSWSAFLGTCLIHLLFMGVGIEDVLIPCLLTSQFDREKRKGQKWVLCKRVSSKSQLDNTSLDTQDSKLRAAADRYGGNVVKEFHLAESAASMERESANQIAEMAEDGEYDVLALWKLDRLTRADPWESITYLHRLQQTDITLYAETHGFLDWNNLYDFRILSNQVVFAREWYNRIKEGAEEGQLKLLRQGKWPFGKTPFGYNKRDNDELELTDRGYNVIPEIFKIFIDTEVRAETQRRINNKFSDISLSDSNIKTVLGSKLPLGQLALKGEVVKEKESLKVINKETYRQAQEILAKQQPSQATANAVPEAINHAAQRFGPKYTLEKLSAVNKECRKCGGELVSHGTTQRWDHTVKNFRCKECSYQGPLLTTQEYQEFHSTLPLRCPKCPSTEYFTVTGTSSNERPYLYNCQNCGTEFGIDEPPGKYKRAFESQELAFRFDRESKIQEKLNSNQSNADLDADQAVLSQF